MEGKMSKAIFSLQSHSLAASPSRLNIADWSKRLISQVLQISHAQWVFHNVSLHDARSGYLHEKKRRDILSEIDCLSQLDPEDVPLECQYLLEMDFTALAGDTLERQSYP